jgi:hypothetical protein
MPAPYVGFATHVGKNKCWLDQDIAMQRGATQFVVITAAREKSLSICFGLPEPRGARFSAALDVIGFFAV